MALAIRLVLGLLLLFASVPCVAMETVPQWQRIKPADPVGRYFGAQIYDPVRDRMVLFGGFDDGRPLDELWQLSLAGGETWQELVPAGARPSARYLHAAVYDPVGDRMIVSGGSAGGAVTDEIWALRLSGPPTWESLATTGDGPGARFGQTLSYDAQTHSLYAFGGVDALGAKHNDLWRLALATMTWHRVVPPLLSPGARRHAGIWDTATSRYLMIGGDQGAGITGDAFMRPVDSQTFWEPVAPGGAIPARADFASVYLPARRALVCFGGEGPVAGTQDSTTWTLTVPASFPSVPVVVATMLFDTLVIDSVVVPPAVPHPRLGATFVHDRAFDRCVLYGGQIGAALTGEVWALWQSPVPHWRQVAAHGVNPLARKGHAVAYDPIGRRMILFGGQGRPAQTWSFTLSDSMRGTWSQMSLGNPPATYGHTAVYDSRAHRVLMFGGVQSGAPVQSLWQLTLTGTPAWSQVTVPGINPPARSNHVAVYDSASNRLLIQGGVDAAGNTLDDMWMLNIGTPLEWTRLWPPTVVPEPRNQHVAAFDVGRRRLLVHGGLGAAILGDMWAYEVDRDLGWKKITPSVTPPVRRGHTLIHDTAFDKFVMFGGYGVGTNSRLGDLWQFNPDIDMWLASAPASPPLPRGGHAAIYDPARGPMLAFGGDWHGNPLSDLWELSMPQAPWNWTWRRLKQDTVWPHPFGHRELIDDEVNGNAVLLDGNSTAWAFPLAQPGAWVPFGVLNAIVHTGWWDPQVAVDPLASRAYLFSGGSGGAEDEMSRVILGPASVRLERMVMERPQRRSNGRLIYDPPRRRMVLFGGGEQGRSGWQAGMDGQVWTLSLTGTPQWAPLVVEGTPPSPRTGLTGIYDPLRDRMIYFGGHDSADSLKQDTWALELSGTPRWTRLDVSGPPPHRASGAAAYDPLNDRMLVFGGVGYGVYFDDLWSLEFTPTLRWRNHPVAPPWPEGRLAFSDVYIEPSGEWVVTGGVNATDVFNDLWVLTWTAPTATTFSLVGQDVSPTEVVLVWEIGAALGVVHLERRRGDEAWQRVATQAPDGQHRVRFRDADVRGGEMYAYRAVLETGGEVHRSQAVTVTIPSPAVFALEGVFPNPARRGAQVRFSLPDARPARLELIDVMGRRVMRRDVGALGVGTHAIDLHAGRALQPGIYVLRLETDTHRANRRVVVVD